MVACLLPSPCNGLAWPCLPPKRRRRDLQVRAKCSGDQGRSMVDENMSVLKERIGEAKMRERLERWWSSGGVGWNYHPGYDCKLKRNAQVSESLYIAGLMTGTLAFTFLSGTFCLCCVSLLAHLNH